MTSVTEDKVTPSPSINPRDSANPTAAEGKSIIRRRASEINGVKRSLRPCEMNGGGGGESSHERVGRRQ